MKPRLTPAATLRATLRATLCETLSTLPATVLVLSAVVVGCSDADSRTVPRHPDPANRVATDYARVLDVDLAAMDYRRHSGLFVRDVVAGRGARADSGDVVTVHYTGRLPTGRTFDSSLERNEPFEVALGYGRVIDGWDQGVVGMRVGGQRRLVIPPALGYGADGQGAIPGGATLVFDVELLDVVNRTPEPEADAPEPEADAAGREAGGNG